MRERGGGRGRGTKEVEVKAGVEVAVNIGAVKEEARLENEEGTEEKKDIDGSGIEGRE